MESIGGGRYMCGLVLMTDGSLLAMLLYCILKLFLGVRLSKVNTMDFSCNPYNR